MTAINETMKGAENRKTGENETGNRRMPPPGESHRSEGKRGAMTAQPIVCEFWRNCRDPTPPYYDFVMILTIRKGFAVMNENRGLNAHAR
jgi:hypothetical protein